MSGNWTEDDLRRVEALIATGEQSVQYEDKKVVYRGMGELLELRDRMRASMQAQSTGLRLSYGVFGKGL